LRSKLLLLLSLCLSALCILLQKPTLAQAPPTPTLSATVTAGHVNLSWNTTAGSWRYYIYRGVNGPPDLSNHFAAVYDPGNSIVDVGQNGNTYTYVVKAANFNGENSPVSNTVTVPVNLAAPRLVLSRQVDRVELT
jgi:hypothetical protein